MTRGSRLRLAAVLAFRDLRGSRAHAALATLSIAVGVAGIYGMQLVAAQLSGNAASNSRQWIAADAAVELDQPISPDDWKRAENIAPNLKLTLVTELPAIAESSNAPDALAIQLKAVDPKFYPFYGTLELKSGRALSLCLNSGAAIVSQDLLDALHVHTGQLIRIHGADFRIADVIAVEPDRFAGPYSPAPRVIISSMDLVRTGLLRFSDTAFRHLLFSIPPSERSPEICGRLETLFPDSEVIDYTTPMPLVTFMSDLVGPFVRLIAALMLGFGTLTLAALSYLHLLRQTNTIAILKSLGATSRELKSIFLLRTLWLALVGSTMGLAGGWFIDWICDSLILRHLGIHVDSVDYGVLALQSLLVGILASLAAQSASLQAVHSVSPSVLLRRDTGEKNLVITDTRRRFRLSPSVVVLSLLTVLLLCSGDSWRAQAFGAATIAVLAALILLSIRSAVVIGSSIVHSASRKVSFPLRYGLKNPRRYGDAAHASLMVLVVSIALVLIAGLARQRISALFADSFPLGGYNLVIFNASSSEVSRLDGVLSRQNGVLGPLRLIPTVLLGLDRVDDVSLPVLRSVHRHDWIQRMWPATCADSPPQAARVLAGAWWTAGVPDTPAALEENVAALLGAHVGSRIVFQVDGKPLETKVAAIVSVPPLQRPWYRITLACQAFASLRVDSFSGGLRVEPSKLEALIRDLQQRMHKGTVVDISQVRRQAESVGQQGSRVLAVASTLLAGVASALLLISIAAYRPFRFYEIAILRALGAGNRILLLSVAAEHAFMGAIAGFFGAVFGLAGANLTLWYLTARWTWVSDAPSLIAGISAAILLVAVIGVASARTLLRLPPLEVLRRR